MAGTATLSDGHWLWRCDTCGVYRTCKTMTPQPSQGDGIDRHVYEIARTEDAAHRMAADHTCRD